jgi:hypothetical protein
MAYTTYRSILISGATATVRCRLLAWTLKDKLTTEGWVVQGSSDGVTVVADYMDAVDRWTTAVSLNNSAWICLQNVSAESAEMVMQVVDENLYCWRSDTGGYGAGQGAGLLTRVGTSAPPADELQVHGTNVAAGLGYDHYVNIAADVTSFILFSKLGVVVGQAFAYVRLTGAKVGDVRPYWSYLNFRDAVEVWDVASLSTTPTGGFPRGYHPAGGTQVYRLSDLYAGGSFMTTMGADPYTGKFPMVETLAVCTDAPYQHIRGVVTGIWRTSGVRSLGDLYNTGDYVQIGNYAVPWGSVSDPLV